MIIRESSILYFIMTLLFVSITGVQLANSHPVNTSISFQQSSNLFDYSPISISSDAELETHAISGNGTVALPYIIEGYRIVTTNYQHGILISGTTKHFVIKNNFIDTGGLIDTFGIVLNVLQAGTGLIENNILVNNYVGILLMSGSSMQVRNNTVISSLRIGIEVRDNAENANISSNVIIQEFETGINIEGANSTITNNKVSMGFDQASFNIGIAIHRDNIIVKNNTVTGSWEGINLSPVLNALVINNYVYDAASGITGWPNKSLIANNTVMNGKFDGDGIRLQGEVSNGMNSNENTIRHNLIVNYPGYGVNIFGNGANNTIYENSFINNRYTDPNAPQALDYNSNQWYEPNQKIGNYWSDNIHFSPYIIVGGPIDEYPLNNSDFDVDGMNDAWEFTNGLDLTMDDSNLDPDNDGLSNIEEFIEGSDPNNNELAETSTTLTTKNPDNTGTTTVVETITMEESETGDSPEIALPGFGYIITIVSLIILKIGFRIHKKKDKF